MTRDYYQNLYDFHKQVALEKDGFYDSRGHRLKHHPVQLWARRQILDLLTPILSGKETLLDAGCGRGDLAVFLKKYFPRIKITGIDIVPEMIHIARRITQPLSGIEFHVGGIQQLPYENCFFDVVIANNVLHCLLPQDQPSALAELVRVSRKYLILELKNKDCLYHRIKKKKIAHLPLYPGSLPEMKEQLRKDHFIVEKEKYFLFTGFLSPWIVLRAKKESTPEDLLK